MFKFLKRKSQEVVRVENLQVGDVIQWDLVSRGKVRSIALVPTEERAFENTREFMIEFDDVTPGNHLHRRWTYRLFAEMNLHVWR